MSLVTLVLPQGQVTSMIAKSSDMGPLIDAYLKRIKTVDAAVDHLGKNTAKGIEVDHQSYMAMSNACRASARGGVLLPIKS
jgi:hypothetical protein